MRCGLDWLQWRWLAERRTLRMYQTQPTRFTGYVWFGVAGCSGARTPIDCAIRDFAHAGARLLDTFRVNCLMADCTDLFRGRESYQQHLCYVCRAITRSLAMYLLIIRRCRVYCREQETEMPKRFGTHTKLFQLVCTKFTIILSALWD